MNNIDPTGTDNCEIVQSDGSVTRIPNCVGNPDAPPDSQENVDRVVVVGRKGEEERNKRGSPIYEAIRDEGEIAIYFDSGEVKPANIIRSCVINGREKNEVDIPKSASAVGHTHGTNLVTGLGPEDFDAASSGRVALQIDLEGTRTVDIASGSFRAIRHGGSWGDLGRSGTSRMINKLNAALSASGGAAGASAPNMRAPGCP